MKRKILSFFMMWMMIGTAVPLWSAVFISGPLDHDFELAPGAKLEGTITLINPDDHEADVKLYQVDLEDCGKTTTCGAPGSAPRSNALWVSLGDSDYVTLQPHETKEIKYKIEIPMKRGLHGTYWSVIMVEPVKPAVLDKQKGFTIASIIRYGVQIITSLGDEGEWDISVAEKAIESQKDRRVFTLSIKNSGTRAFKAPVFFQMFSKSGTNVMKTKTLARRIFPDSVIQFSFDIPNDIAAGEYQILLFLENDDDFVGVEYDVTLPEAPVGI